MTEAILNISVDGSVGVVEINKPPHNFFDVELIAAVADAWEDLERDSKVRAIVLCSNGKSFCAGADFSRRENVDKKRSPRQLNPIYLEAIRMFACTKPVVAAIEGPAIGGGLGMALTADFRITCEQARFSTNFNRLGFHPGFALSYTLPQLIGQQKAAWMFYTGARIDGLKALELGLVDALAAADQVRATAMQWAREIAVSSPRAVQTTRATLLGGRLERIRQAVARESEVQAGQMTSEDLQEGVAAARDRRNPVFKD